MRTKRLAAATLTAALLIGIIGAPAVANAASSCATITASQLTETVIAATGTQNMVRASPDHAAAGIGVLSPDTKYAASPSFACNDGWFSDYTAISFNGAVDYVPTVSVYAYIAPSAVVWTHKIQAAPGLLPSGIHSGPSANAPSVGTLVSGTVYDAGAAVAGTPLLSGTALWFPVRLNSGTDDSSVGWVNTGTAVEATASSGQPLGENEKALTEYVVTGLGDGSSIYSATGTIDFTQLTQADAGRGDVIGTLTTNDIVKGRAEIYSGISIGMAGALSTAITAAASENSALKPLEGKWRLITFNGQPAWAPATSFSTKATLLQRVKAHAAAVTAAVKKDAKKATSKIKSAYATHKASKASTPSLGTWLKLLPAGAVAFLALLLAAFSFRRVRGILRFPWVKPFVRPAIALLASTGAVITAVLLNGISAAPLYLPVTSLAVSVVAATATLFSFGSPRGVVAAAKSKLTRWLAGGAVVAAGVGALTLQAGWLAFAAAGLGATGLVLGARSRSALKPASAEFVPTEEPTPAPATQEEVSSNGGW